MGNRSKPGDTDSGGPPAAEELFLPSVPGKGDLRDFGLRLRRERELRGVSLDDVARVTRVNRRYLAALEGGRADLLPAEPFVKGFLAAYARHVGLVPDEILSLYEEARRDVSPQPRESRATAVPGRASKGGRLPWVLLALAAAGVVALAVWSRERAGEVLRRTPAGESLPAEPSLPEESVEPEEVDKASPPAGAEAPPGVPGAEETGLVPATGVELVLEAGQKTWVYAVADEKEVRDLFLQPGERVVLKAARGLSLTLGNAGGVSVTFNGRELGLLGKPGEVKRDLSFSWDVESGATLRDPYTLDRGVTR